MVDNSQVSRLGKHSPRLKQLQQLEKASVRQDLGLFLIEGPKLLQEAYQSAYPLREIFFDPTRHAFDGPIPCWQVESAWLDRVSEAHQGVVAVAELGRWPALHNYQTLVVADGLSDPGNLGTLMRTTWAAGVEALVCLGGVDPHHPKVVRASAGAIFHLPVLRLKSAESLADRCLIGMTPRGGTDLYAVEWPERWGLVVGNESHGLTLKVDRLCSISMHEPCESLNAAVSASIVLFEYRRVYLARSS